MRKVLSLFALAALFLSATAQAQSSIYQGGPTTAGHLPVYIETSPGYQPTVMDSGPASGGGIGIGIGEGLFVNPQYPTGPLGTNICDYDAPVTSSTGFHYLCFSPNSNGAGLIAYGAVGTAVPQPLQLSVNGTTLSFLTGPTSSTQGYVPLWGNTLGSQLLAGVPPSLTIAGHTVSLGGVQPLGCSDLSNAAASCSIDATNASNIGSGTLASARLPLATNLVKGAMEGDGSTISCTGGVCSVLGQPAATIALGTTLVTGGTNGYFLYNNNGIAGNKALPTATSSTLGLVETDGSTISIAGGKISCTTGTANQLGCVKPDGTTITASNGVLTATNSGNVSGPATTTSGYIPIWGNTLGTLLGTGLAAPTGAIVGTSDNQTLTNKSIDGGEVNSGTVSASYLPQAGASAKGIMEGDGTTISCSSGVCTATGSAASSIVVGTTLVSSGTDGYLLYNNNGTLGNIAVGTTGTSTVVKTNGSGNIDPSLIASGAIGNSQLAYSTITIGGSAISLGGSVTTLGVAYGGSGATSFANHDVLVGEGTSAFTAVSPSSSGYVLTSNGTLSDPSFQAIPNATSSVKGIVETDGSTISVTSGEISCTTATTSQIGCSYPDNSTIGISSGEISVKSGGVGSSQLASGAALANIGLGNITSTYLASGVALTNIGSGGVTSTYLASGAALANLGPTPVFGTNASVTGTIGLAYGGGSGATTTISPGAVTSATAITLPASAGTLALTTSNVTSATNLAGGLANYIPYQTGAATTSFVTPVDSALLVTNGSGVPSESTTIPTGVTANSPPSYDSSGLVATTSMVQAAIDLSMAYTPLANITGGTYSFASLGTAATITIHTIGGVITSYSAIPHAGSSYVVGDIITMQGGNHDSYLRVATVSGTGIASLTILDGGTGYSDGADANADASVSAIYSFALSGTLATDATFIVSNGTHLTASNQWVVTNNTTGAYNVKFYVSNGSDATTGSGVVIPQGTGNKLPISIQTDGVSDVWYVSSGASTYAAAGTILNNATAATGVMTATATPVLGVNATTTGTLGFANGGGSGATTTVSPSAVTSATAIVLPATAGTLVGSGDTGTVTNTMLAHASTTVNSQTCTLGGSCTVTASAPNQTKAVTSAFIELSFGGL